MHKLATILSVLLHPALLTTYSTFVLFNTGAEYPYLNGDQKLFMYGFIFLITFVLPLSLTPLYFSLGWVKSIYMTHHRERTLPLIISSLAFYAAYFMLKQLQMNSLYLGFIMLSGILVFLVGVISAYWKISAHLSAMGGLVGLLVIVSMHLNVNTNLWLIIVILLSGVLASARLYLGAHKPSQVFAGFALGFFVIALGIGLGL